MVDSSSASQGTSSSINNNEISSPSLTHVIQGNDVITFSEYPVGTAITNQYASQGIVFGGDNPFITTDGANPTSPVLSGTPLFVGNIEGQFVDPSDGTTPIVVESFKLDAGYFDELNSTRIEWFDPNGVKLGQKTNSQFSIETFEIEGGNIASWRIGIVQTEPNGFAIDNISFEPIQSSVLFREKSGDDKDGTWGFFVDEIPGYDHVGFHKDNQVYESHPGYPTGLYRSDDGQETANIVAYNGVQAQHTLATFKHDSIGANSPVVDFEEIPISRPLAENMQSLIESQISAGAEFQFIDYTTLEGIEQTLSPDAQKGGGGTFTCVGLVEWASEQANHNNGQGFVLNVFESITLPVGAEWGLPPSIEFFEFPLLSPELMNHAMKFSLTLDNVTQWYQGIFDPVDFIITDPFGRRLGYSEATGVLDEIPVAFYSGNGNVEQFLIPNAVPGDYQIEFFGLNDHVYGGMASSLHAQGISTHLGMGETLTDSFNVETKFGSRGDVNYDGCIDNFDRVELLNLLNTFASAPNDPADIDGDGVIDESDLGLLDDLIAMELPCANRVFLPFISR